MSAKDTLNKLSPKVRTLLLLVIPFGLAAAFAWFYYLPAAGEIKTLEQNIEKNEGEIAKSKVMERKLAELKEASRKLEEDFTEARKRLPSSKEEARLLERINELVTKSGMTLKAWTPGEKKLNPSGLYSETRIAVEVEGDYHELGKFMEGLDGMTRLLSVDNLSMSSAKLKGMKMSIPIKFDIIAYSAAGGQ